MSESTSIQLDGPPVVSDVAVSTIGQTTETEPQSSSTPAVTTTALDIANAPSPPVTVPPPPTADVPEWVKYDEDTSTPDEAELKEIEADEGELNAANCQEMEDEVFVDLKDPEYRPYKKLRLSWTVKGVRGTRDKPNRARIISSPSVCVEGKYWNLKLFPRGSKSRNHLAVFVRCSPTAPEPFDPELQGSWRCYAADPSDKLPPTTPIVSMTLAPQAKVEAETKPPDESAVVPDEENTAPANDSGPPRHYRRHTNSTDSTSEDDSSAVKQSPSKDGQDFRLSAQLGLVVYNPDEPRTCYVSEAEHQFCPAQDDWGWQTAVSEWQDIHRRKRGQRQALLRNDTLAIDVYARIYDDPTQSLFWHESPGEPQWDSKTLTDLFPMGTRNLYHSPAVAGITAFALLVPFRQLIQGLDAGAWRRDSSLRPRPLIAHLQLVLFQMRHMRRDELFVHLDDTIHEITKTGEQFEDVKSFWEVFRRALGVELGGDEASVAALHGMFGDSSHDMPLLPVQGMGTIQKSVDVAFSKAGYRGALPNFLPLMLDRQSFDYTKREWQLHHDRIHLLDELDMSKYCTESNTGYVLYGFVCHDGERSSNRFFSVLRPAGPGTKWLVFSDGNGNKIFSYTRKRLEEYEGLADYELTSCTGTRQTAYMAMYIRSSCIDTYLADKLEPYKLPVWLKNFLTERVYDNPDLYTEDHIAADDKRNRMVKLEIWSDRSIVGHQGKIDIFTMKARPEARNPAHFQQLKVHADTKTSTVKAKIAQVLGIKGKCFKLWVINYSRLGAASKAYVDDKIKDKDSVGRWKTASNALSLWLTPTRDADIDQELRQNFCKLSESFDGAVFERPPREDPLDSMALERTLDMFEGASSGTVPNIAPSTDAAAQERIEATREGIDEHVTGDAHASVSIREAPSASDASDESSSTNSVAEDAAADVEQAAVRAAVERTVVQTLAPEETSPITQTGSAVHIEVANAAPLSTTVAVPSAENSESADRLAGQDSEVAQPADDATTIDEEDGSNAVNHADADGSGIVLLSSTTPTVIALGGTQAVVVQSALDLGEGLSAEDAALISSMIAADLQERETHPNRTLADSSMVEVASPGLSDISSLMVRPMRKMPSIYGFLQHFEVEKQTLTTMGTFVVERDTIISDLIRSRLPKLYAEDRPFQVWKREGTFRTIPLDPDASFQSAHMTNCCEVIVGDELSTTSLSKIKAEGKLSDPGQLMRYDALVKRGHPLVSKTSSKSVEISDFGGDYYFGPLLNGQRHGAHCKVITAKGDQYDGPLVAGQKMGEKGVMVYQNGDVYRGSWVDDKKEGQGELVEQRTGNRYVGGFENDKRWGKGITYWEVADQQAAQCQVCYFEEVDALFYRCGHVVACYSCAKQCSMCPICRKSIDAVVKMYRS